jgi:hypothetical protein
MKGEKRDAYGEGKDTTRQTKTQGVDLREKGRDDVDWIGVA